MIGWINPATGLAGDMLLAALIDAGAPLEDVRAAVTATGLTGWGLTAERVTDHGLAATRIDVHVTDAATQRPAADVVELASRAIPAPVAALAVAALTAIAEAEAALHGSDPAAVHLHELGGHDTLIDIVGTAAALHALGVTDLVSSPLPLGTGLIVTRHGLLPCPAPATLVLLRGAAGDRIRPGRRDRHAHGGRAAGRARDAVRPAAAHDAAPDRIRCRRTPSA